MRFAGTSIGCVCAALWFLTATSTSAEDWPQWRGPNRDAKATGFNAPAEWPEQLTQMWKVTVGDGVATPAVVGDRVFVFSREDGNEVIRALNASNGEEIWQDSYEAAAPRGGASGYAGPRSSPAVADGKVVTLGVQGTLCSYDAQSGRQLWRKDEFDNEVPDFYVGSSPIIVGGMVIAQLGGRREGGIVAYDLTTGDERWRWTEDSPSYGSPVRMNVDGDQILVTPTDKHLVAIGVNDGKTRWKMPFEQGRYNSFTPVVEGSLVIVPGPGTGISALRITKSGRPDQPLAEERVWSNADNSLRFNSPVLKDGMLFGLSGAGELFCINIQNGDQTAWTASISPQAERQNERRDERSAQNSRRNNLPATAVQFVQQEEREGRDRDRRGFDRERRRGDGRDGFRGGRGGGGGGRRGGGGYGSIVDAGDVLLALSPAGQLVVFKPTDEAYTEVARYTVADDEGTYAYPVAVGRAIYIKDRYSVSRWGFE